MNEDKTPAGIPINCMKMKRKKKRKKDFVHKRRIKFLAQTCHCYPPPAVPIDRDRHWNYSDVDTVYYKRIYRSRKGGSSRFYKKYANRVVRRHKGEVGNGCAYKRYFDYQWTLW